MACALNSIPNFSLSLSNSKSVLHKRSIHEFSDNEDVLLAKAESTALFGKWNKIVEWNPNVKDSNYSIFIFNGLLIL